MKTLKKFLYVIIFTTVLTGCEVYEEPTLLSLSGEYRIDKITYEKVDNSPNNSYKVFYPGTTYVNPTERFPMDSISVGETTWAFDYAEIFMSPYRTRDGRTMWMKRYFYNVINHTSVYELGYIEFNCDGSRRVFKILDDGMESLTLRSTGHWGYAQLGPNVQLTLHLTRIGP